MHWMDLQVQSVIDESVKGKARAICIAIFACAYTSTVTHSAFAGIGLPIFAL